MTHLPPSSCHSKKKILHYISQIRKGTLIENTMVCVIETASVLICRNSLFLHLQHTAKMTFE